ncbi:MAG: ABC transporter ATP-binding protein, partial [Lachnospiraceae bacterium]|nr:ABC transporter ATP-binding protein [Lachnospiraceae bacterium]
MAKKDDTLEKVFKYIKNYRIFIILSLVFAAITVVLTLYLPILTGDAVDMMVSKGLVNFEGLSGIIKKMAVIIVFTGLSQWIMNVCNNKITYNVVRDIRDDAFKKIEILPVKYIDGHASGDIVSRVIADADQFADGLL